MLKFEKNIADRKVLVNRLRELTGIHPTYTRAPLYAYDIGDYMVDREGNLLVEAENAEEEVLSTLLNEGLIHNGTVVDGSDGTGEAPAQETAEEASQEDTQETVQEQPPAPAVEVIGNQPVQNEPQEVTVESAEEPAEEPSLSMDFVLPVGNHTGVSLRNLVNLIYSRGSLISKATNGDFAVSEELVEALKDDKCTYTTANFCKALEEFALRHGTGMRGISINRETVTFSGFGEATDTDRLRAYGQLAVLMNNQAIMQKRIQAKQVDETNEKYSMRIWLIRMGMSGDDFKETRKYLMENLHGHTAFRTPEEAEKAKQKALAKRRAAKESAGEAQSDVDAAAGQDAVQSATAAQESIVEEQGEAV